MTIKLDSLILQNTIQLAVTPRSEAGLATPVLLDSGSSLDGDRYRVYTSPEEVDIDLGLTYLSAFAANALNAAFLRTPRPAQMIVASVDLLGTDTYVGVLDELRALFPVVAVSIDSRTSSDIAAVGLACATRKVIFVAQSSDSDFLNASLPAALSTLDGVEWVVIDFHDDDSEPFDFVHQARNIAVDPDQVSRAWTGRLTGVDPYTNDYTAAEVNAIIANNVNVIGELDGRPGWVFPGRALSGRPASELVTATWFDVRWKERLAGLFERYDARDLKFPVTRTGQEILRGEAEPLISRGVSAGHFVSAEQVVITLPEITQSDRDNQRVPIEIVIQTLTGAITIASSVSFSREPVIEE